MKNNIKLYKIFIDSKCNRHLSHFSSHSTVNKLYLIKPIASFSNCDIFKKDIFLFSRDHINKGVIYCWVNNVNNKCYVGSSVNFSIRLYKYYSFKYLNGSKSAINKALLKYGYSNFSLHILEHCDKEKSINREQYFIDLLKPEYNILSKAGSSLGFKHSEDTLKKYKDRKVSETTKKNLSLAASERVLSNKEKEKLSLSRLGKNLSLDTRNKISISTSKLWGAPVQVKDIESNTIQQYLSLTDAANAVKVSRTAVKKALTTGKAIKKKWIVSTMGRP